MKAYKNEAGNWQSGDERERALEVLKEAEDNNDIMRVAFVGCNRCGQTKGILQRHVEDCKRPLETFEVLCWSCQAMQLVKYRSPEAAEVYAEKVAGGFKALPYHKPDYIRFNKENEISEKKDTPKSGPVALGLDESRRVHEMIKEIDAAGSPEKMTHAENVFVSDMVCVNAGGYSEGQGKWVEKIWEKVLG